MSSREANPPAWTQAHIDEAIAKRAQGLSHEQIGASLNPPRSGEAVKSKFKQLARSPEQVEHAKAYQAAAWQRKKKGTCEHRVMGPRVFRKLTLTPDEDQLLTRYANDCKMTPALAATKILIDVLKDDAKAHGLMEAAE